MAASPPAASALIRPDVRLDGRRALWFESLRLLVVADLHWGFAVSHRARGHLLPVWGDEEIAMRLLGLIADYRPAEVIWLGDSLHSLAGRSAAEQFLATAGLPPTIVIAGNHDRRWALAGEQELRRGLYVFHHGDLTATVAPDLIEVIGHHHPAMAWSDGAGSRLKLPALVDGPRRLILPAFSPWAAGTAWNGLLGPAEALWAVTPQRVFRLV